MSVEQLARCEFKYPVSMDQVPVLRRALERFCVIDRTGVCNADGWYTIDSLYLDTPYFDFFRDAEDERPVRRKLRARSYPDTPGSIVKIEVKRRIHELILKTSLVVPQDGWDCWIRAGVDLSGMKGESREALDTFVTLQRQTNASPKFLVRYTRLAFHSTIDDYVRVTFDRRMLYQPMQRYSLDADPRRWSSIDDARSLGSNGLLMEVKFRNRPPVWIGDLIRRFGLVRQGFSKYGTAVRLSRRERPRIWDLAPSWGPARSEALPWTC
jgi:hypothetical protein